jgi:perosamine synthetase
MIPDINEDDIQSVAEVLRSGMLIQGINVEKLEKNLSEYLEVKHAVAVSSGTATLHIALVALGIGPGDEVIVPAFSYIATANVVEIVGAKPVFVDIDIRTFNIDVTLIEQAITNKTKAIMPVHEFGLACDITEVCKIAEKYNLKVIEDAACALGASENGKFVGTFGDAGSFSFHPRKAITSGEGGLLVTNSDELAEKFRILRNHGIRYDKGKMDFVAAGFNYRMTDFQAALVNSQFQRFEKTLNYRIFLANIYSEELKSIKYIQIPFCPPTKRHSWQSYHILVDTDRDILIEQMKNNNIGTNYGAQCMPYQTYFQKKYGLNCEKLFPNALKAFQQGLVLPLYSSLTESQLHYISLKICELGK